MRNQFDRRRFIAGVGVSALGSSAIIPLAEANAKENSAMNVVSHQHFHATPAINPELARLIACEKKAKMDYDDFRPAFDEADRKRVAGQIGKRAFRQIEREEEIRLNAMCDAQCDVIAFPAVERADTIAKAKWIASRYPKPAEFMSNESDAIWAAFVTAANATA